MKLHILGAGVIGRATGEGFHRFGHQVVYTDKGDSHNVEADLHFVCVPEDAAPMVVRLLEAALPREPFPGMLTNNRVVVRSSVLPGTTAALAKECPKLELWHNPEFLREATAESDFLHASRAIIGHPAPFYNCWLLDQLYGAMQVPVYHTSSTISELVKLVTNAYLATNISFWNEMLGLFKALDVNGHTVARLVALDPRVSHYGAYQFGQPYGGKCLPKDVQQLLTIIRDKVVSEYVAGQVLTSVQNVNRHMGGA